MGDRSSNQGQGRHSPNTSRSAVCNNGCAEGGSGEEEEDKQTSRRRSSRKARAKR